MAYELKIEHFEDYISVEITGVRNSLSSISDSKNMWIELLAICTEKEIKKVLAVSKLTGRLGAVPMFNIVDHVVKYGISRQYKLAYVDLNPESLIDNKFGETVAYNRGYQFIKVFGEIDPAKEWLKNI